ncbi:unnamed protein product [Microthlaspi erraticum]|uniref:Uncharacterized protein n=1 Tax=Microthlaspi erraticum TaxID=1685480 RepID=A0A6D2J3Z4_9BRAS|nr:unnamed protein product [Microthlaspi erraticum]
MWWHWAIAYLAFSHRLKKAGSSGGTRGVTRMISKKMVPAQFNLSRRLPECIVLLPEKSRIVPKLRLQSNLRSNLVCTVILPLCLLQLFGHSLKFQCIVLQIDSNNLNN